MRLVAESLSIIQFVFSARKRSRSSQSNLSTESIFSSIAVLSWCRHKLDETNSERRARFLLVLSLRSICSSDFSYCNMFDRRKAYGSVTYSLPYLRTSSLESKDPMHKPRIIIMRHSERLDSVLRNSHWPQEVFVNGFHLTLHEPTERPLSLQPADAPSSAIRISDTASVCTIC